MKDVLASALGKDAGAADDDSTRRVTPPGRNRRRRFPRWERVERQPSSVVPFVVEHPQGNPQDLGGFFLDFENEFRLFQASRKACVLALELRHTRILGRRFGRPFPRRFRFQQTLVALPPPLGEIGRVQPFATEQGTDLPRSRAGIGLSQDVELVRFLEATTHRLLDNLRVGVRGDRRQERSPRLEGPELQSAYGFLPFRPLQTTSRPSYSHQP